MQRVIYLVEDDTDIRALVEHHLKGAGFQVRSFGSAAAVTEHARRDKPALFLLDVMLPGSDGFALCDRIRGNEDLAATPIIFLTAKASERDRVSGLELGADDYIAKPFSPRELVARVKAVLRRVERPLPERVITAGRLKVDSSAAQVTVAGRAVSMTATEFRLLEYLAAHPGRVFSREKLLDAVWRETQFVTPRVVDVYVRRLREKIEEDPENPVLLRTMRGLGYKFESVAEQADV